MTLNVSWKDQILLKINAFKTDIPSPRIAIVGIGNELNGDDAVGCLIADSLSKSLKGVDTILVINGGLSPENHSGTMKGFGPQLVIFIDASWMNENPGCIKLIDFQGTTGFSASTHTFPIRLLSEFLRAEIGCETILLGIQPQKTALLRSLSQPVYEASNCVIKTLSEVLDKACASESGVSFLN